MKTGLSTIKRTGIFITLYRKSMNLTPDLLCIESQEFNSRPQGYKTFFFMLNSAEHEISGLEHQSLLFILLINVNNCWHFNIYEQDKF